MSSSPPQETHGQSLGPVLILVGSIAVILANAIPESTLGDNQDPGPRAFPIALGTLVILGGAYELGRTLLLARRHAGGRPGPSWIPNVAALFRRPENHDVLILIGALTVYLAAMPWLGFAAGTWLFSVGMMVRLGARWPWAIAVSTGLVLIIHLLFVMLFKVQLPAGVLGISG